MQSSEIYTDNYMRLSTRKIPNKKEITINKLAPSNK